MARDLSERERRCLEDERRFLHEDMDKCGYCSDSYAKFSRCWQETAKTSGTRSRGCLL
jgi:hypothetical protein